MDIIDEVSEVKEQSEVQSSSYTSSSSDQSVYSNRITPKFSSRIPEIKKSVELSLDRLIDEVDEIVFSEDKKQSAAIPIDNFYEEQMNQIIEEERRNEMSNDDDEP